MRLTAKQEKFCNEYLIDLNGAQAAIRSGYKVNTAKEIASENLTKPHIKLRLSELKAELEAKIDITPESVLRDLKFAQRIALGLEDTHVIVKNAIGGGMTETTSTPIKKTDMTNYVKINEMYMKHLGMFTDRVDIEDIEKRKEIVYKVIN